MKLTVVSITDPKDKHTWSGTTSNMYEALKRNGQEVDTITLKNWASPFYKRLVLANLKFFKHQKTANFETTLAGAKYWGRRVTKEVEKHPKADYYLTPGGASVVAFAQGDAKFVDLPDATYELMNNYYYAGVDQDSADDGDKIDRYALQRADKVILPSKWAYQSVVEDYKQPENKLALIPFGANLPDVVVAPKKLDKKVIELLLVGVEWERKGVDIALEVVKKLNVDTKDHEYHLTIIGLEKPTDFEQENVTFKGRLDKNDPTELKMLEEEYRKADLFILPTQAEAAGIVFAEAAMYALPTLTYKTGGVTQYVLDKKTGFTLDPTSSSDEFVEKIQELVADQTMYTAFSKAAVDYYKSDLNWDAWAQKVCKFLED